MGKKLSIITIIIFLISTIAGAQENILQHSIHYFAYSQNMWGPDNSYGIDVDYTFFDLDIDESWGFTEITEIFGEEFGVGFQTGIQSILSSTYEAHGFDTGSFDLDYPVLITLDFPIDFSFDYGGPATIHTSYDVTDGWDLSTEFPPVGITTLDLEYMFNPYMDFIFCVFGCDTIHIIPSDVQVPHTLDTLFHINGESGYTVYPCFEGGTFGFCHDYDLPIEFSDWFDTGITAFVTLPYVITEDYIVPETNCLVAEGDSLYMNVHIDIIHFLHSAAGLIPPPDGENIQSALEFLADTISYPIPTALGDISLEIAYELLGADFDVYSYMHQKIEFCPTIWANLSFPTDLPYRITDPTNGDFLYNEGTEDTITVPVGHDLTITYPCHDWDSMYVGVEYDISPTIRNHTYDSIAFVITVNALTVSISIETPFKKTIEPAILPEFQLPEIIDDNNQILSISSTPIMSPGVSYDGEEKNGAKDIGPIEVGPLFTWDIPLGHTDLTWFDETWEMENFVQDTVFPGTYIKPFDKSELQMNMYTLSGDYCYGDSVDYVYAQATDSLAPLTYIWSTGDIHNNVMNSLDSLHVIPGYYAVTITDDYGCTSDDEIIIEINPPIINTIDITQILCHGENTGVLTANTSGGFAPFSYDWSYEFATDGLNHNIASDLPSGWHYLTITDWAGCTYIDSAFITEPPTALESTITSTPVDCYGGDNGTIDISISGAQPPYIYTWADGFTGSHVENVPSGIYTVSITDQNDCLLEENIEVHQPDTLIGHADANMITCYANSNGNIAIHPEGGTPPYNYQWFHNFSETSDSVFNLPPGLYMCTVTDSHNCRDTISQYITQPDSLWLDIRTGEPTCQGLLDGWIAIDGFGGTPPYTYDWGGLYPTNVDTIPHLGTNHYYVTLSDNHGCQVTENIFIDEPFNLSLDFTNIINISCFGLEDGSVIANVNGGTQPYDYNWSSGVQNEDSLAYNMDADVEYSITIVDSHSCNVTGYLTLTEPDKLEINGTTNPVECGVSPGSGTVYTEGGTTPYAYEWSNGETSQNATELPTGEVGITVTDINNCQDSLILIVNRTGKVSSESQIINNILCYGDSTASAFANMPSGFSPIHFSWYNENNILISESDTAYNLAAGIYTIETADLYMCADTIEIEIPQPDSINPNLELIKPSCSSVYDGQIITHTEGGTMPYYYLWSTGSLDSEITNICDGYYMLTVTDFNSCQKELEINLEEEAYCIIIHNTITPNGDGKNDVWIIENITEFPYSEIWIFNRNGIQVYNKQNYQNNWDGRFKNEDLPEGTYYYVIDPGNGGKIQKGHLTIIR